MLRQYFVSAYRIYPAVLRQATYGTIKFGTYYSLKKLLVEDGEKEDIRVNIFCAVVAGIISSSIANPTDVLKVRMQAHGTQTSSIIESFLEVYRQEGIRGLWRVGAVDDGLSALKLRPDWWLDAFFTGCISHGSKSSGHCCSGTAYLRHVQTTLNGIIRR